MTAPGKPAPPLTAPLLVWLTIQLLALCVGSAGVQLSAQPTHPPESIAIDVMLATQIATTAILWPWLFRHWQLSLAVIATALPFTQAAGFLSATPTDRLVASAAMLLLWLTSLAALPAHRFPPLTTTVLRGVFLLLALGGAVATYFRAEFADPQSPTVVSGPIVWSLRELTAKPLLFPWICGGVLLMVCTLARVVMERAKRGSPQA
jgi:hypothetical protein